MRVVKPVNLTPHRLDVIADDGFVISIEPSGEIARCDSSKEVAETVKFEGFEDHPVTIYKTLFGDPSGVPAPEKDVLNMTSMVVARECHRDDVSSPGDLVRDENGVPKGCRGLSYPY